MRPHISFRPSDFELVRKFSGSLEKFCLTTPHGISKIKWFRPLPGLFKVMIVQGTNYDYVTRLGVTFSKDIPYLGYN